ncbi:heme A synthase [Altericista sp. CCNU0014]|uniref:COX15/CtaA family protein n=1 Tax=Altericista sp. CCNU0014 TaxID=3082949 RepID=UPI00384A4C3B
MADSSFPPSAGTARISISPLSAIRKVVYGVTLATLALMALGSATRVMNAGLSCPDWPLCYGTLVPSAQMNLQVFLEWFHRLVASSIGFIVLGLTAACWRYRKALPGWLPISITLSLGIAILQGLLGGLTVTQLLRFDIVTAHLAVGLLFFCSMAVVSSFIAPYQGTGVAGNLYLYGTVAALCIYVQSVLGALVASRWAVHQCLDIARLCQVLNSHMFTAVPASLSVLLVAYKAWRTAALHPTLRNLARVAVGLLALQVAIGVSTLRLHLQVEWLTVSHQVAGAALFGTLVLFSVVALRDRTQVNRHLFAIPAASGAGVSFHSSPLS